LVFTGSSARSSVLRTALRAAAEGALVGIAGCGIAAAVFRGILIPTAIAVGTGTAWLASSVSVAGLAWGQRRSTKAFWWSFGGGMALRAAALAGLMGWSWRREGAREALLLSYVFGVLAMLLTMEVRHIKPR
jgi:hypothetical protein